MKLFLKSMVVFLATATVVVAAAKRPAEQKLPRMDNLQLFNLWDKQPDDVMQLFEACHNVLKANLTVTFADVAADAAVQRLCSEKQIKHLGGPMLGDIAATIAKVWLRMCRPSSVEVRVMVDGRERKFGQVKSTTQTDLSAVVSVIGLKPATRHPYRVLVDGAEIPIPAYAAITTTLAEPNPASVRIAFGTCSHRFGLGNEKQAETIRSRNPAAMLLGGDVCSQDRNHHLGMHRADSMLRDVYPAWQGLVAVRRKESSSTHRDNEGEL